jgi:hypothetical protein
LDIRVYRRSAFLIFCEPGAIEMDAGTTAGAIRRDRVRSFSFFLEQNSGANAPRERLVIASAGEAIQLLRAGAGLDASSRSLSSGWPFRAEPVGSCAFWEAQSNSLRC